MTRSFDVSLTDENEEVTATYKWNLSDPYRCSELLILSELLRLCRTTTDSHRHVLHTSQFFALSSPRELSVYPQFREVDDAMDDFVWPAYRSESFLSLWRSVFAFAASFDKLYRIPKGSRI